jgi:hypothetical protein
MNNAPNNNISVMNNASNNNVIKKKLIKKQPLINKLKKKVKISNKLISQKKSDCNNNDPDTIADCEVKTYYSLNKLLNEMPELCTKTTMYHSTNI